MTGDGKLYIIITDKREQETGGGGGTGGDTKEKEKTNLLQHQINQFLINQAKQIVNASISNIGNFTGDFQTQRNVQAAVSMIGKAAGIITSFAVNPVLGVFAVASSVIGDGLSIISNEQQNKVKNYQITQLRDYSGLDNGSR